MSLRAQLALLTAVAVALAVIAISLTAYFATRQRLRSQVDASLRERAAAIAGASGLPRRGPGEGRRPPANDPFASRDEFVQVIDASGNIVARPDNQDEVIPVTDADRTVAAGARTSALHDARGEDDVHLRVLTTRGGNGEAVQVARSLADVDASLASLRNALLALGGGGIVLAGVLGMLVAQRALRPVSRLTAAAEHVAETQELGASIEVRRRDEIGRLADSFNAMLRALDESRRQQQQLVMDASHELRTPLTSLRTNIEVLARSGDDMPDDERRALLRDATAEMEELTTLIGELVDLAAEPRRYAQSYEDVRLDEVARAVAERASRRTGIDVRVDAEPTLVSGNPALLERAVGNYVDNACKWSPPGGTVEVSVRGGVVRVRDHGPGIDERDLPHVFDRFYRSEAARAKPGSGLGLSIVKKVVEEHGGRAWVERAPGGGTVAAFTLPAVPFGLTPGAAPGEDSLPPQAATEHGIAT
jgi:two-component system sensor histidine kinase MprB